MIFVRIVPLQFLFEHDLSERRYPFSVIMLWRYWAANMASSRRVVFLINSLTSGGAEHALVHLLACMRDHLSDLETHLVLLDEEAEYHSAPPWVRKHVLDARHALAGSTVRLLALLMKLRPAVTLSFLNRANCANVIASRILQHRCVISERTHTTSHLSMGRTATFNKAAVRLLYRFADHVIAVSEGVKQDLTAHYGVPERKVQVVYNPINIDAINRQSLARPAIRLPRDYILANGRLVPSKNFRLLIEAYQASGISEALVIMGEGDERTSLERLISERGLAGRVILPGHVQNPYPIIRAARALISSSNLEGFPNALVEALALGCMVVATDCQTGPAEILRGSTAPPCKQINFAKYGILVPTNSVEFLAAAIRTVGQSEIRDAYSRQGRERARDFSVEKAVAQFWSTIAPFTSPACRP